MGLITKEVEITWNSKTKQYYIDKGYIFTKIKDPFIVKIEDLTKKSTYTVEVECDNINCNKTSKIPYHMYSNNNYDNKYYCKRCSILLFGNKKSMATRIKNGKSFEKWCIENNMGNLLDRWDYELNKCNPNEVSFTSTGFGGKGYYFKCPKRIHESELKSIHNFTKGQDVNVCNRCNSFAQWGIDNICEDFLEKYWDYSKNTINPWDIAKGSYDKKIWIYCQNLKYHGSYETRCLNFVQNKRCPYCVCANGKVHTKDSVGQLILEKYGIGFMNKIFSEKNKKTLFNYSKKSKSEIWWKCHNGKHDDYKRRVSNSNKCDFLCPSCTNNKGENKIAEYLLKNDILFENYKKFEDLIGSRGGKLSYDFYLPKYKVLIEYQGSQHREYNEFFHRDISDFNRQKEHDRIKGDYAIKNGYNLIEIFDYDFESIAEILNNKLFNTERRE